MQDYTLLKLFTYGIGLLIILLWMIFGVFSYSTSMILTAIVLVFCMLIEAKEAKRLQHKVSYHIRIGCAVALVVGVVLLFVLSL